MGLSAIFPKEMEYSAIFLALGHCKNYRIAVEPTRHEYSLGGKTQKIMKNGFEGQPMKIKVNQRQIQMRKNQVHSFICNFDDLFCKKREGCVPK